MSRLLPIAKACHGAASRAVNPALKRRYMTYVIDIWNMFGSFCVCAVDAMTVLPMYSKSLLGAMTDATYRELSIAVCKGLTLLIRSNQMALENREETPMNENDASSDSETDPEVLEAKIRDEDLGEEIVGIMGIPNFKLPFLEILNTTRAPRLDRSVATANLEALQTLCEGLLMTLLSLYEQWHGDFSTEIPRFSGIGIGGDNASVQIVRCALETMFSIAPSEIVTKLLKQILGKLLAAFTNENPAESDVCAGQSIILTGLLSTVIRYVKDDGENRMYA